MLLHVTTIAADLDRRKIEDLLVQEPDTAEEALIKRALHSASLEARVRFTVGYAPVNEIA